MSDKASVVEEVRMDSIRSKNSSKYSSKEGSLSKRRSSKGSISSADKTSTKHPPGKQPSTFEDKESEEESEEYEPTERERKIQLAKTFGWSLLKSCSSNLGLLLAVIGYSILGGYIFNVLEEQNERNGCHTRWQQYNSQEEKIVERLKDIAFSGGDLNTTSDSYKKLLSRFRKIVYEVDYTGDNCTMIGKPGGPNLEWSISGATMFAVTVTTTVGYGHISPKTFWGKMVCIAYAILGIPLMLLFLANIGEVLCDFFRFFYTKICCCGCCRRRKTGEDAVDSGEGSRDEEEGRNEGEGRRSEDEEGGIHHEPPQRGPIVLEEDEDEEDDFDDDNITIPLTITLGVIGGYVMLGSLLFGIWEDWDLGDAAYFSFITLSTVGFGDLVPGKDGYDDPNTRINMLMGGVYMIFGMAILSMCFTLIQDEITAKFSWVGEKLGLTSKLQQEDSIE